MQSKILIRWYHIVLFLAPAVIIYTVFMTGPLIASLPLSLFKRQMDGTFIYIGFENFNALLNNPDYSQRFWGALLHSFHFFAVFLVVQNPVALLLATLLSSRRLRGAAIYRTLIFSPTTLSIVIVGWIWALMLNPLWGVVNNVLKGVGLASVIPKEGWLGSPDLALTVVALVGVWQYVGLPMILFLAALVGIDEELVDAAHVDGASSWAVFWRIKFPLILPTVGIVTVLTFVGNFSAFENVFVMEGSPAGPDYHTDLLGTFFYRTMFGSNMGQLPSLERGTAIGTLMFLIILTGVVLYLFGFQRRLIRD